MSSKSDSTPKKGTPVIKQPAALDKLPTERVQFRRLLLQNPNFFGTLKGSPFKSVTQIASNTTFEEMMCLGFNPQLNQLEAVVHIKRETGYGGGICADGTPEYVRFYVSHNNGAAWHDIGLAQFNAQDIPGEKPLEYAVIHHYVTRRRLCFIENVVQVRAILSWNAQPPPDTPDYTPIWGNVREANIQIAPTRLIKVTDIFDQLEVKPSLASLQALDLEQTVATAEAKPLGFAQLQTLYKDKKVPEHRFLFPSLQKQTTNAFTSIGAVNPSPPGVAPFATSPFADLKIDVAKIFELIDKTDGNTSFEELTCVGLDTNTDTLVGVVSVKLSSGYSGPLCSAGSREYVAFWVDWGDGAGWNHAGTTSVVVHDIANLPKGGLQYAVFLPLNTLAHRQSCTLGAKTAKVRAILSWEQPPPPGDPDFVPTWGNREETRVLIKPGPAIVAGDSKPYFETVGGVAVCHIDQTTGFAAGDRPFGGVVNITGFIVGAPDLLSPDPLKYKLTVTELATSAVSTIDNAFAITVLEQIGGGIPTSYDITQTADADGYFTFREDMNSTGAGWRLVTGRLLGQWITAKPMTGLWEIKLEAKDHLGNIYPAGLVLCSDDGTSRQSVKVYLDEEVPDADVKITGFTRGGAPLVPTVDCATLQVGDVIHGEYKALDEHFGSLSLTVEPSGVPGAHSTAVNPPSRSYPIVATTGETGTWTLDTGGMDPCGYVVRLVVNDRTIVSGNGGWQKEDFVGFCLAKKP